MKNPSRQLREAYFSRLNGNVIVNGSAIPVFNTTLPDTNANFYIILSSQTGRQERDKCRKLREHTQLVDIVTKFDPFTGNNDVSDDILNQVSVIINNGVDLDLGADFECLGGDEESTTDTNFETPNETIIRKLIRFRHLINIK